MHIKYLNTQYLNFQQKIIIIIIIIIINNDDDDDDVEVTRKKLCIDLLKFYPKENKSCKRFRKEKISARTI